MCCCKKNPNSGEADQASSVTSPTDFEKAFLKARKELQTSVIESVEFDQVGSKVVEGVGSSGLGRGRKGKRGKTNVSGHMRSRVLWECFIKSGGRSSGGYIKKVKRLWDEIRWIAQGEPSLM